ncbi:exlusion protein FxsA [Actibacterium mucosum KCTC 23349]|uniref:Exlusion protein FxsA n=1 Tax=Actibacterium mucosum KCTC 23349 TaxID=1454373 RepID=A0A037ZLA9_9RHOB|nr:FxsA family protein [Actibacterium mucosum]KAJ57241.1 exlusion protein FxsA [Actibacterium mucosum KCTC 23349]
MWLLALFIGVPLIEIALFIQVGGAIGLWSTLAIVVLTAVIGTSLMRRQGAQAMANIRGAFNSLSDPSEPLAHGAMILFSGALLLTPGFFTDAVGFALLVPAFRSAAFRFVKSRVNVTTFATGPAQQRPRQDDVIDGEFEDISPKSGQNPPSGWTRD